MKLIDEEFNLSREIIYIKGRSDVSNWSDDVLCKEDVREFIKRVKALINRNINITVRQKRNVAREINQLAGKSLIEQKEKKCK